MGVNKDFWHLLVICNNELHQPPTRANHDNRNKEIMRTAKKINKETEKSGELPVKSVAADGVSSIISFKNDPNLEILVKTSTFPWLSLLSQTVTTATWNHDDSDLHSNGLPWPPCGYKTGFMISDQQTPSLKASVQAHLGYNYKYCFYLLKVHGVSTNLIWIRKIATTCNLSFHVLKNSTCRSHICKCNQRYSDTAII